MTVYNNLKELLDSHGYESPYQFGRSLYKYTDCGPWTVFLTPDGEKVYYKYDITTNMIPNSAPKI